MKLPNLKSTNERIPADFKDGIEVFLKREDLIHPTVSGNKYRKLKYNLIEAERKGLDTLLSFGGAFSNHIAALAAAGKDFGFKTIGIIRGDELVDQIEHNPTLHYAKSCGMDLKFVSRTLYRNKTRLDFLDSLDIDHRKLLIIPEGGTNSLAIKGCEEILTSEDAGFDYICCPVGTGGTISGIINTKLNGQQVLGFPALKGSFLREEILIFAAKSDWQLVHDYHFGGYAKVSDELIAFINKFKHNTGIALDPVYTAKMMFGVYDMIANGWFPKDSKILCIHTGGLQGIDGMNMRLKQQNRALIV